MRKILITVVCLTVLTTLFVFVRDKNIDGLPTKEEVSCVVDEDCTTVAVGCDGCSCGEPINKVSSEKYRLEQQIKCVVYNGPVCDVMCQPYELKCVSNKCTKQFVEVKESSCSDKEEVRDYYKKGETTTCMYGNCALHEDFCFSDSVEEPEGLYEAYCKGDEIVREPYDCPKGCLDGACVK